MLLRNPKLHWTKKNVLAHTFEQGTTQCIDADISDFIWIFYLWIVLALSWRMFWILRHNLWGRPRAQVGLCLLQPIQHHFPEILTMLSEQWGHHHHHRHVLWRTQRFQVLPKQMNEPLFVFEVGWELLFRHGKMHATTECDLSSQATFFPPLMRIVLHWWL